MNPLLYPKPCCNKQCYKEIRCDSTAYFSIFENFLQGIHVTVAARSEADIDENDIIQKVAKSSGSQYSIHKEKAKPEDRAPSGPVVSD